MADDDIQRIFDNWERVQARKAAPAVDRDVWIAAARQLFAPGERQPCWICGKFKGISQAHHVVPLTTQYDRGFEYPDHEYVWLCPNHHVIAHIFLIDISRSIRPEAARARSRTTMGIHPDVSRDELDKIFELMRRAARGPE